MVIVMMCAACGSTAVSPSASGSASSAPSASQALEGLVTTIEELPSAAIQIAATGSFVSPEFGEFEGAGSGSGSVRS